MIKNLDLSSDISQLKREFDPSFIANQFEKGISTPKFSNPKYWFIKGPIKTFINKIIEFYSLIDKKLSENRIKAFYSVIYELIKAKKRIIRLEKKFYELNDELNLLKTKFEPTSLPCNFYDPNKPYQVEFDSTLLELVNGFSKEDRLLIFNPEIGELLNLLKINHLNYEILTYPENIKSLSIENSSKIKEGKFYTFKDFSKYNKIIFYNNICFESPTTIDLFISNQSKFSKSGTEFILKFSNVIQKEKTPFWENTKTSFDEAKLIPYLKEYGFSNIKFLENHKSEKILSYYKN